MNSPFGKPIPTPTEGASPVRSFIALPDDSPSPWSMIAESNFLVAGAEALADKARDYYLGYGGNAKFDSAELLGLIEEEVPFTPSEQSYLKDSSNIDQFRHRLSEVRRERNRAEDIGQMSLGSQIGWGILGAALDPTSYIPLTGQLGKVKNVRQLARANYAAIKSGQITAKQAAQDIAKDGFALGFWHSAGEAFAYESAFQSVLYANRINTEGFAQEAIASLAMTSALSGVIGGSVAGISRYSVGKRIARGSEKRIAKRQGPDLDGGDVIVPPSRPGGGDGSLAADLGIDPVDLDPSLKAEVAEVLNKPRPPARPATPKAVETNTAAKSVKEKIAFVRDDTHSVKMMEEVSRSVNGMADWLDFVRYAFGKGMSALMMDHGPRKFVFRPTANGLSDQMEVVIRKTSLPGTERGRFNVQDNTIDIDYDYIVKNWGEIQDEELVMGRADAASQTQFSKLEPGESVRIGDIASSPQEYADWVVMHEVAHQILSQRQTNIVNEMRAFAAKQGLGEEQADEAIRQVLEGQTNRAVMDWIDEIVKGGPDERPDIAFHRSDGMTPKNGSIPLGPKESPTHALMGNYRAQGFGEKKARQLVKWLRLTSPLARASSSTSKTLRTVTHYLVDGPFYKTGASLEGGSAMSRVQLKYERPTMLARKVGREQWREISNGLDRPDRIDWEEFDARVHRAVAIEGGDPVSDAYSPAVKQMADRFVAINKKIEEEGFGVGWVRDQKFPDGERYYRRVYNNQAVKSEEFVDILVRNGATLKGAREVQRKILGNMGLMTDEFETPVKTRGSVRSRGDFLKTIRYDELAPYLNTSGFESQLNAARSIGGEVELRQGMQLAARELGVNDVLRVVDEFDENGVPKIDEDGNPVQRVEFDIEPIRNAMKAEFDKMRKSEGLIIDPENMSLAYEQDWKSTGKIAQKYPEHARQIEAFVNDDMVMQKLTAGDLAKESSFADKWLDDLIATLQHTRDIPTHPDSWWETRMPALIKNYSHSIMGGALAISNIADFHRSVTEFGFMRTFGQEWSLWLRDAKGWAERNRITEEMGLALEDQAAEVQRMHRNVNQHVVGETGVERFAEKAASAMSHVNLMDWMANSHQRAFSSGVQSYLIDMVPKLVDGTISGADALRLGRLGITKSIAENLKAQFDAGGVARTAKGTAYFKMSSMDDSAKEILSAAVARGVDINQNVPSRIELFDWQTQGWGSVLMMYRNWVTAANNRLMASVLSNPDKNLMSGLVASIGIGALVTMVRGALSGDGSGVPWEDTEQFLRRSIDNGGYLGLVGEANNLVARITDGTLDMNPIGEGKMRYYDSTTALAAVVGPAWHYPNFVQKTFNGSEFDRYDIERIRGMIPFMNLFYIDGLWNQLMEDDRGD